jgi:hypothetical protein
MDNYWVELNKPTKAYDPLASTITTSLMPKSNANASITAISQEVTYLPSIPKNISSFGTQIKFLRRGKGYNFNVPNICKEAIDGEMNN